MEKKEEDKAIKELIKKNHSVLKDLEDYDENGIPYWELVKPITADMRKKSNWKFYKKNPSQKSSKKNDKILLDDYEEEFKETKEMEIVLKALKTTFWFFFWTGSFLLGFLIGRSF